MPHTRFTQISNAMLTDSSLSDGAIRLHCYLASLPNGKTITDAYVCKVLQLAPRTLARRKLELKERDLIEMVQLAPRIFDLYIGYPGMPASKVKAVWDIGDIEEPGI